MFLRSSNRALMCSTGAGRRGVRPATAHPHLHHMLSNVGVNVAIDIEFEFRLLFAAPQVLDAEEYDLLMRIRDAKARYRDLFNELQLVKSEVRSHTFRPF